MTLLAPALNLDDERHRRDFMEYCIHSAEPQHRRVLSVLYEHFERWNDDFFSGQLIPPHFLILEPIGAKVEGDYTPVSGWGSSSQIRIRPTLITGKYPLLINGSGDPEGIQRYWLDTALHECMRQYCYEVLDKPEKAEKGHGTVFAAECSRVGALMGLPPVGPARKTRNTQNLPSCAGWPRIVRQPSVEEYYRGAYNPEGAPRRKPKDQPSAPSTSPSDHDESESDETQTASINPLSPAEWSTLFAIAAEVAEARPLVMRLAQHHQVTPAIPAAPTRTPATSSATAAPRTPVVAPLPSHTPAAPAPAPALANTSAAPAAGGFVPSSYQQGIFDFITHGEGDGLVNAVAGSGKTTSLVQAARLLPPGRVALFVAFNKHIALELGERLKGTPMVAKTIHSIGHGCVTKRLEKVQKPDDKKYAKLTRSFVRERFFRWPAEDQQKAIEGLTQLTNFARVTLTDPKDEQAMRAMIAHFGVEIDPEREAELLPAVAEIIAAGVTMAEREKQIDFTDMIYLPFLWKLQPPQVDFIFADECQDLNAAQLDLILKCRAPGGRLLAVGDPNQSIYGFAGADSESFWKIQERTGAKLLPLSICYRCPSSHLDLARRIVPQIEAQPGAPSGIIGYLKEDELPKQIRRGDMILCRLTAPLVKTCIKLIENHIPAQVRGRDIGKALTDIVRAVAQVPGFRYDQFGTHLNTYAERQLHKLTQRPNSESQVESLTDRIEAVRTCYNASEATTAEALCDQIDALFSDAAAAVLLSTIHRAKGLENDRIFILKPDALPLVWPKQQEWEAQQEENLHYVALTRATRELYFVQEKKKKHT